MLAAIGLVETGFQAIAETEGGPGRGVFQITVAEYATEEEANNLAWAASWTARALANSIKRLSTGPNAIGGNVLVVAALSAHNAGLRGIQQRILSLVGRRMTASELTAEDVAGSTTSRNGRRTGNLYRDAMTCFQ
jgi:hypothetical protein